MPSIKDKSTVNMIAQVFCGESKRNKVQGMIAVGYTEAYANSGRGQRMVYENVRVKQAIAKIDAVSAKKHERTVDELDAMYQRSYDLAESRLDANTNSMNGSVTGIARLYGMDKNADAANPDQAVALTDEDRAVLKAMVKAKQDKDMSRPNIKLSTG